MERGLKGERGNSLDGRTTRSDNGAGSSLFQQKAGTSIDLLFLTSMESPVSTYARVRRGGRGGEKRGKRERVRALLSPTGHVGTRSGPVYADEWNSFQGTSGPFSNTSLRCGVDANTAEEEYVSRRDRQSQGADKDGLLEPEDESRVARNNDSCRRSGANGKKNP